MSDTGRKWKSAYRAIRARLFQLPPNASLGLTIEELATEMKVNHKTIQRAVKQLVDEQLLVAKPRVGLSVHPRRPAANRLDQCILLYELMTEGSDVVRDFLRVGADRALTGKPFRVLEINIDRPETAHACLKQNQAAAALFSMFYPSPAATDLAVKLRKKGLPVVSIDEAIPGCDAVVLNNRQIGRTIARYVFSHSGILRTLFLRRRKFAQAEFERESGIESYINDNRIGHARFTWMTAPAQPNDFRKLLPDFLSNGMNIDAVYIMTMDQFNPIRDAFAAAGKPEPRFVKVGFEHDMRECGLNGVVVKLDIMAEKAVELAVRRAEGFSGPAQTVQIEGEIFLG